MTKTIKWRLTKLPTPDEVRELVKDKILTNEEAREILFSEVDEQDISVSSLQDEIKFLRELIQKLSTKSQIVETIRYIEKPYQQWGWYQPYYNWCSLGTIELTGTGTTFAYANGAVHSSSGDGMVITNTNGTTSLSVGDNDFTEIKTF